MVSEYERRLGTDKMLPLILRMALPSVAAQLINLLYSIVDRIYIGHIENIGTDALAGVGVTSSVIILISAFSSIVGGGGAPLASIALGKNDRKRAGTILGNGFVLLVLFTVVTSALTYIFMEPLLMFTGASEDTIGYARDYLNIYLVGTLFVMIFTGLNSFINAQGRPTIAMVSVLIGAVLNIILDPIFIYGLGMNVKGAALATVISQFCSAVFVLGFLCSKKASLRIEIKYMKPDFKIIGSIFALGIAPFIMASTESLVGFVLNGILKGFGDIYVSTLTVMQSAMQFATVPLTGFAQGFVPIVSYNYGQNNPDRVKLCFKYSLAIMVSIFFIMNTFMMIFPEFIAGLFTDDTMLIEKVGECMPLFLIGMTIFGLQRTCQNMFVALGQSVISLFIALLRKVILLVPLAIILSQVIGVHGVFIAESVADATSATCCTIIFCIFFPRMLKKMRENNFKKERE